MNKDIRYLKNTTLHECETISINELYNNRDKFRLKLMEDKSSWETLWYKSPSKCVKSIYEQNSILGEQFVYERNLRYPTIERNFEHMFNIPKYLKGRLLLYNSGIAAIINTIRTYIDGYNNSEIRIIYSKGYFETYHYLMNSFKNNVTLIENIDTMENCDILFIEPVTYFQNMEGIDYEQIIMRFINETKYDKIKMIIVDCTLITHLKLNLDKLYMIIKNNPNIFLVITESILKLYQLGLEISSAGIAQIIYSIDSKWKDHFENFIMHSEKNRELYSVNLSLNNLRGISHPFIYDNDVISEYTETIFYNNEFIAQRLLEKNFTVKHPSLDSKKYPWSVSPIILIIFKDDRKEMYIRAVDKIEKKVDDLDLKFEYGSSFGFFESRYEIINYSKENDKWFLKIAIGYNKENLESILSILNDL